MSWPVELRVAAGGRALSVAFDGGESITLDAEYLRVESPSAEVQGHVAAQKQIVPGKRNVAIENLEPVGNYAVRILFDDGHDTGLYSWDYLLELAHTRERKWAEYLAALKARGLGREG